MTSGAGRGAAPARTRTTAVGQRRREAHALDDCDGWRERGLQRGEARAHQPPGRPVCESGRSPGQGGRRLNDCHRFKMRRFELRTLLNAGRRPSRTLRDSSVSHVVAGATMAIVRVSVLAGASQVEPCAGSSFLFVSFPASFTCFVHSAHSEGRRGGSEGELRVFVFLCTCAEV